MGEISRPQERQTFDLRPFHQGGYFHIRMGPARITGMDMEIGEEFHRGDGRFIEESFPVKEVGVENL